MVDRTRVLVASAALACLSLASCVGPARTEAAYRGKALGTIAEVRSDVQTMVVALRGMRHRPLPAAYASTLSAGAEEGADAAQAAFSSVQPPTRSADRVRRAVLTTTGEAVDELAALRIEARRGGIRDLDGHLRSLHQSTVRLDRLAARLGGG
ncbi:MAG: hypothetical protein U0P45_07600 [Acidimicrobiales bacterium]